jgi:hypothetical protein
MTSPRIGLAFSSLAILGSLILATGPATAEPILGTGLIRIDGTWATVKTLPNGSTVLTLNKEASGQWMGEIGRSLVPGVRDIDDRRLVSAWNELGHASGSGVQSTLTWNSVNNFESVELSDPSMTPRGHLRFVVDAEPSLPARMENVSVNISRSGATQARSYPLSITYAFTASTSARTYLQYAYVAEVSLNGSGVDCYEYTLLQSSPYATLPASVECGSVSFANTTSSMNLPNPNQSGDVLFNSTITTSGSPFPFTAVIASWTETGSPA